MIFRRDQLPYGWSWSRRKIILSTAGWVPGIDALAEKHPVRLAVSLHAADEALRAKLMPVQKRYSLSAVLDASERYVRKTGLAPFFEITLLRGINDSVDDAEKLLAIADRMPCAFNLIPYNPGRYNPMRFERPEFERVKAFQHALVSRGITATIRKTAGGDVAAACGQLATVTSRISRGLLRNKTLPSP
jgi:23S rRNA (adenine2503-C2)-methyltransferase